MRKHIKTEEETTTQPYIKEETCRREAPSSTGNSCPPEKSSSNGEYYAAGQSGNTAFTEREKHTFDSIQSEKLSAIDSAEGEKPGAKHWKIIAWYLRLYDVLAINFAYFFGLWLRFDLHFSSIPQEYLSAFLKFAPIYTVIALLLFQKLQLYHSLWRFASFRELNRMLAASVATTIVHVVGMSLFVGRMPVSYYIIGAITQMALIVAIRFSYRYVLLERTRREQSRKAVHNAMVIGAGAAGQMILRELNNSDQSVAKPLCVIDDNVNTWHRLIEGVPIVGGRESIMRAVEMYEIDQILFAIPTASAVDKKDILELCKETGCELKILPGIYQLAKGEVALSKLKPVAVEDLLGREPVKVKLEEIFASLQGKTILVTGGGGSIGSELCRQIAGHAPKRLILFDIYENNAYDIEQELRRNYPDLALSVLIGSVRDGRRVREIFETYRPEIVYHAAAHKHVPLMESSPKEAIKNNVIGTYQTAYAALKYGAQRFVLISTDKAINPTNIMGASKRVCEMIIQAMDAVSKTERWELLPKLCDAVEFLREEVAVGTANPDADVHTYTTQSEIAFRDNRAEEQSVTDFTKAPAGSKAAVSAQTSVTSNEQQIAVTGQTLSAFDAVNTDLHIECVKNKDRSGTQFVAVRFGNVLGSNGSVIPLFRKQIEAGGPVTVTHPNVIRYFMTIPEAVSLVLQAGTYAWGGEIFVLDMGVPVKIDTLARNLIRLSGYKPDEDIKIVYTGLRPGEKLYEEMLMEEEGLKTTDDELIHIAKPISFDIETFFRQLETLARACYEGETGDVIAMVAEITGTYRPAEKKAAEGQSQTVQERTAESRFAGKIQINEGSNGMGLQKENSTSELTARPSNSQKVGNTKANSQPAEQAKMDAGLNDGVGEKAVVSKRQANKTKDSRKKEDAIVRYRQRESKKATSDRSSAMEQELAAAK